MRYPLFADIKNSSEAGFPRNIAQAEGEVEIFNTDIDDTAVWALTLYVWWHTASAVPANPPALIGRVYNDGEATTEKVPVLLSAAYFTALSAAQAPRFAPAKIVDRLCLRGNQVFTLANSVAGNQNCFVYGYVERVGVSVHGLPYRPLQPEGSALASPYNGDPISLLVADQDTASVILHKVSNTYIDVLTLNIGCVANSDSVGKVIMPNGLELLMPYVTASPQMPMMPLFDGIPMRASSASLVNISMEMAADGAKQGFMLAYGNFLRS